MKPLQERLAAGETLVSDGATGTMLLQMGMELGECPESICLEQPANLETIARQYADAGADIVHTNTFGASPIKLSLHGLAHQVARINETAVLAVRRAVGDRAYISGCCGPCGKLLKPHGDAEYNAVYESFRVQAKCLADSGVDVICVETMTDLTEAVLAVQAAKDAAPHLPIMAAMTFDPTRRGFFTVMGVDVPTAASGLRDAGADVVGSNCGNGIDNMVKIASVFHECTDLPLIIQSNAGLPKTQAGKLYYDETPEFMAERVHKLLDVGVSIIGGCCGTTPDHIRAIRKAVDAGQPISPPAGA
jgi:5-methyltetrahydrofolate--homocysteine methyltransferase